MSLPKSIISILKYLLFFGLALILLWFASKDFSWNDFVQYLKNVHYWPLILLFVFAILSHLFRALRWKLLISPLNYKVGTINTFLAIMIGYLVNLVTPRMGEIARCGILAKYENVPADKLAGTMIAERVFDFICLIILIFITYFVEYETVNNYFQIHIFQTLLNISIYKIALLLGGILISVLIGIFLLKKINKKENKFNSILQNLMAGFLSVKKMEQRNLFFVYTFLIWFLYWAMAYIGFKSLDELSNLSFGAGLSVLTFGSFGIVLTPGGTGSYQLIIKEVLSQLYHIPVLASLAFANIAWAAQNLVLIIGGVISLILLPILNNKKNG